MASPDRKRMRDDLHELARLASPEAALSSSAVQEFESADSSGYVDLSLSSFSYTDDGWVDRALVRANGGAVLTPGSMRPVALEALLEPEAAKSPASRRRAWLYSAMGVAGAAVVAVLA